MQLYMQSWDRAVALPTFWKEAMVASLRWRFQLKEGEQLYASSLPGCLAWMAAANSRASSRSGVLVSTHSMSAKGAYARPRAMAAWPGDTHSRHGHW